MYKIKKKITISGSHRLNLSYKSPCQQLHGHNWNITVHCESNKLDKNGMIIDFSEIKRIVNILDHKHLNDIAPFNTINPTAENMAHYLCVAIPNCVKVEVEETDGNIAIYEGGKDEEI